MTWILGLILAATVGLLLVIRDRRKEALRINGHEYIKGVTDKKGMKATARKMTREEIEKSPLYSDTAKSALLKKEAQEKMKDAYTGYTFRPMGPIRFSSAPEQLERKPVCCKTPKQLADHLSKQEQSQLDLQNQLMATQQQYYAPLLQQQQMGLLGAQQQSGLQGGGLIPPAYSGILGNICSASNPQPGMFGRKP